MVRLALCNLERISRRTAISHTVLFDTDSKSLLTSSCFIDRTGLPEKVWSRGDEWTRLGD